MLLNVMSIPKRGEKASLMLTVDTLYIDDGIGMPEVASDTKPIPGPISSIKVLYDW